MAISDNYYMNYDNITEVSSSVIKHKFKRYNSVYYHIDNTCIKFRKSIVDYFINSDCDIYRNIILRSINVWSTIYTFDFFALENITTNNLLFTVNSTNAKILGLCTNYYIHPDIILKSTIKINKDICYQNNHDTCDIIMQIPVLNMSINNGLIISLAFFSFGIILLFLETNLRHNNNCFKNYVMTKFYYILYFALLYVYWYDIRSCFDCYDLMYIILHELGHAFGLEHTTTTTTNSIMEPIYNKETRNCIFSKDIIPYNGLYNTTFDSIICDNLNNPNYLFLTDILIIFLGLFLVWALVCTTRTQ